MTIPLQMETENSKAVDTSLCAQEWINTIREVVSEHKQEESKFFTTQLDFFCSGLVTKIFQVDRRLYSIPFKTCTISHSGIVCETTRRRAFMVEFCEDYPILTHDVTAWWSFAPCNKFAYGGYVYNRESDGFTLPVVSYTVQYVAKLFQCTADLRGEYILSGNNCHIVQEQVRYSLGVASQAELYYSTNCGLLELDFKPLEEMKPVYYM